MTHLQVVIAMAGVGVSIVTLGTAAIRAERRARRLAVRLLGDGDQQPGALDRLDDVWRQMHPNSGSSLRDRVDATHMLLVSHISTPRGEAHRR